MSMILCIETSTDICSVALCKEGELIDEIVADEKQSHSKQLTVLIENIFLQNSINVNDIDAVAVSGGPGSYTGLRIGVSVAKGLCYGLFVPLIEVSTLQIIASGFILENFNIGKQSLVIPMLDARRMEVYYSIFDKELNILHEVEPLILDTDSLKDEIQNKEVYFIGNGAFKTKDLIEGENINIVDKSFCLARNMVQLAMQKFNAKDFADVAYFEPFYLKPFVAVKSQNKILKNI